MGKRGPQKAPTSLAIVRGVRKERLPRGEPVPSTAEVLPPAWLRQNAAALEQWSRLAADLTTRGVVTAWDVDCLADFCAAVATIAEAQRHLQAEGQLVKVDVRDRNGAVVGEREAPNLWARVLRDAQDVAARRASRLGLTPSERRDIHVEEPPSAASLEAEKYLS